MISICIIYLLCTHIFLFFFFNDTATTEIYTLSLHDALPICTRSCTTRSAMPTPVVTATVRARGSTVRTRSEEHTSELQSPCNLVCRLLLEKKKNIKNRLCRYMYITLLSII